MSMSRQKLCWRQIPDTKVLLRYTPILFCRGSVPRIIRCPNKNQFLFNAGNTDPRVYIDTMQIEENEFDLISCPERGTCLYRCGNERYLLQVSFPPFKEKMFGASGGK